jgi:hypothetical protein
MQNFTPLYIHSHAQPSPCVRSRAHTHLGNRGMCGAETGLTFFLNFIWKVYHYFETHIFVHKANTPTAERIMFVGCHIAKKYLEVINIISLF